MERLFVFSFAEYWTCSYNIQYIYRTTPIIYYNPIAEYRGDVE